MNGPSKNCPARLWPVVLLLAAPTGPLIAQSNPVFELFRTTWDVGADSALAEYESLPPETRSALVLVDVADQLLWTGKREAALTLLEVARREAPGRARQYLQKGRALLQSAEFAAARDAFASGIEVVDADTTLSPDEREGLRRRLENRVRFLDRRDELTAWMDAYVTPDGRTLLFKYDPYINTFPSVLDLEEGTVRILYPNGDAGLYWTSADNGTEYAVEISRGGTEGTWLSVDTPTETLSARGMGIRQQPISFEAGGASITGTLFLPPGSGPATAVVLTHGSGLSTRYNLANEALAFAARGMAAYVYDKPGLGESRGGNWLLLSIDQQADYVAAAVDALAQRTDIGEVGVWGFSQGGWVAPLAATRSTHVAFVAMASGAAVPPQEQETQSIVLRMERDGRDTAEIEAAKLYMSELWSGVNAGTPLSGFTDLAARADTASWGQYVPRMQVQFELDWWRVNQVDAGSTLELLAVPVLAMFGQVDGSVPPRDNVPLMVRHLLAAPTGDYTIAVLPGADHTFARDEEFNYQPLYFSTAADWVRARFSDSGTHPPRQSGS